MNKYDFEFNMEPGTTPMLIMDQILPCSDVLEFGCANGRMTKYLHEHKNCSVSIVELEKGPFSEAIRYATDGLCADIETGSWKNYYAGKQFDYIIFADVLEHLRSAEKTLEDAKQFLKTDGKVLISIPNIAHNDVIAQLFNNSFAYREIGLLDNTHVRFWGKSELKSLAENAGFFLEILDGSYHAPFATELKDMPAEIPDTLKTMLYNREYNEVYQFFLVLRKKEWAEKNGVKTDIRLKKFGSHASAAFYWDLGNGYHANLCSLICAEETQDLRTFHVENIPKNCVKVRFDPPAEGVFFIENCRVIINDEEECSITPLNGITVDDNTYLFRGVHAQMEFSLPKHASHFTVMAKIIPSMEKDAEYLVAQLAINEQYHIKLDKYDKKFVMISDENQRIAKEKEKVYQALLNKYNTLEQEYMLAVHRTEEFQTAYEDLNNSYTNISTQYEFLMRQYISILNSQSWKITAPLRKTLDKFKATRIYMLLHKTMGHCRAFGFKLTIKKALKKVGQKFIFKLRKNHIHTDDNKQNNFRIHHIKDIAPLFESAGASVFCKENISQMKKGNRILIISHELNLTGAPVAVKSMSKCLCELGKDVLIMSPHDGNLRDSFTNKGIPVIVFDSVYQSNIIKRIAPLFDLIVVSTNVGAPLIEQLNGTSVPVMWWIHESRASYFDSALNAMPEHLADNIHVYCGGAYAQNLLKEYRPNYVSELLLYCTPNLALQNMKKGHLDLSVADDKIMFALVGTLEERKGQDILAEAIRILSTKKVEQCYFVIVGRKCYPPQYTAVMNLCRDFPNNVCYIEELKYEDLLCLYNRMDCLLCVSRDDPMPIVVTDALSLSKCVICSENTGSATLLQEMSSGLIYHNNSPQELANCIEAFLDGTYDLTTLRSRARETYERYFTEQTFKSNITRIIDKIVSDKTTSVVKSFDSIFKMYLPAPSKILREVYGQDILKNYDNNGKKNILLLSHELSLTGAPVVLHKMAVVFKKQGHNVTILSPFDGPVRAKFEDDGFPVILFEDIYDASQNDFLSVYGNKFDLIVINTVVTYRAIFQLGGLLTPVVWWIHDSHASYTYGGFGKCLPAVIPENVNIMCGGNYAKKQLLNYYPHYRAGELLYAIDDCAKYTVGAVPDIVNKNKNVFIIAGTIERRKGQDIAAAAIRKLPKDVLEQCQFIFIGKAVESPIMNIVDSLCKDMPEHVCFMEPVSHDELIGIYHNSTCLICSSRDDPMPVVVTEMQALSKPVICSENIGNAKLIENYGGGLIYHNDSPEELAAQICNIVKASNSDLIALGKEGRNLYENCFSELNFEQELRNLFENECSIVRKCAMTTVSVVIPTYNAGENFREIISRLNAQQGLAKVEIIVVDSGSSDGTQQIATELGARLIQISQEEFSHSYARNLGAKNATGHVLLFMTQDAMPSCAEWVKQMVLPILSGESCATSCREQCPEGTDLYYRAASWYHARYLGTDKASRIGRFVPGMDSEELRKNASLNDISTAVDRNLFLQMGGYRHSFAEDLDMGIRILHANKNIKLLHNPTVIHGHTRASSYYLRRGFAEGRALELIMGAPETYIPGNTLADMIITGYGVLQKVLTQIQSESEINTVSDFDKKFQQLIQNELSNPQEPIYDQNGADPYVESYVQKLEKVYSVKNRSNFDLVHAVMYYWINVLSVCVEETGWIVGNLTEQICNCLYKQMSLIIGNNLAHMDPMEPCFADFRKLADGV